MKKFILLLFILCMVNTQAYAQTDAVGVKFTKYGGGQWIYCNNPEFLSAAELSTDENPSPKYLLKNEDLKPGRYQVFFCHYNWTDFNVEPDLEFLSDNGAKIRINSVGYGIPRGSEYFDCLGAWADFVNVRIHTLDGWGQYVPYSGKTRLPAEFTAGKNSSWVSEYIYNYEPVPPRVTFNMLVDFEILSGSADVNFAALKSYGAKSREHHCPDAEVIGYRNDTTVKGIEPESLPIVETNMDINVTSDTENGERQAVTVYNPYYPDGNNAYEWVTNINAVRDASSYCKTHDVDSDMLSIHLRDKGKLEFYGSNVKKRDDEWIFDTHHYNTTYYENGMPWKKEDHVPNGEISEYEPEYQQWQFNLGNFGVTNRYHFTLTNSDSVERTVNYMLATSLSSNIAIVRDEDGNMLNPCTLSRENPFAISKGINWSKTEECMFSAALAPGETKKYIFDLILPTNCYGGMSNYIKFDNYKYLKDITLTEQPKYTEFVPYKNMFFNGSEYMYWKNGSLYEGNKKIDLPKSAENILLCRNREMQIVKTASGYAARFGGWDDYGDNVLGQDIENKLYLFDEKFNLKNTLELDGYVRQMAYTANCTYIKTDKKVYISTDGETLKEFETGYGVPVVTAKSAVFKKDGIYNVTNADKLMKISFEDNEPQSIESAGNAYWCVRSLKNIDTDLTTPNIISVSADGINWVDIVLPNRVLNLRDVQYRDGVLYVYGKYEVLKYENVLPKDNIKVLFNNEYLSYETPARVINDRTMIPFRYTLEKMGAKVEWIDETKEILVNGGEIRLQIGSDKAYVNGEEYTLDTPPFIENDKTLIPIRFVAEKLGCSVDWVQESQTAVIKSK